MNELPKNLQLVIATRNDGVTITAIAYSKEQGFNVELRKGDEVLQTILLGILLKFSPEDAITFDEIAIEKINNYLKI